MTERARRKSLRRRRRRRRRQQRHKTPSNTDYNSDQTLPPGRTDDGRRRRVAKWIIVQGRFSYNISPDPLFVLALSTLVQCATQENVFPTQVYVPNACILYLSRNPDAAGRTNKALERKSSVVGPAEVEFVRILLPSICDTYLHKENREVKGYS
jgi:hypothetical protein